MVFSRRCAMVVAFCFKQTAAIYAFVPLVVLLIVQPRPLWRHLLWALAPIAAILLTITVYRIFPYNIYHYAIKMPRAWPIRWGRIPEALTQAILLIHCFCWRWRSRCFVGNCFRKTA